LRRSGQLLPAGTASGASRTRLSGIAAGASVTYCEAWFNQFWPLRRWGSIGRFAAAWPRGSQAIFCHLPKTP